MLEEIIKRWGLEADYLYSVELEERALSSGDPGVRKEYTVTLRSLMLNYLAHHLEEGAKNLRLSADLQRSRERLVTTREEERRRLRRDLHDCPRPQLASLMMGAEELGGSCSIEDVPSGGTRVHAFLPYGDENARESKACIPDFKEA